MKIFITVLAFIVFPMMSVVGPGIDSASDCPYEFVVELEELEAEEENREGEEIIYTAINKRFLKTVSIYESTFYFEQISLEVVTPPPEQIV